MNDEQKALEESIEKWERIVAGDGEDRGSLNCPLCNMYLLNRESGVAECNGCPVSRKAGRSHCKGTPYDAWLFSAYYTSNGAYVAYTPDQRRRAMAELDFLKSLRRGHVLKKDRQLHTQALRRLEKEARANRMYYE